MTAILLRWLVLAGLCLLWVAPAHAEDRATRTAQKHFERAQKLYNLGKFDQALDEYEAAYDAKPLADFLFNIAQCYRNLEDFDRAIFSFKKYLEEKPEAEDRGQVEKFIDELEDKRDAGLGKKFVGTPPPPPPPRAPPKVVKAAPFYKQWWFWTGVAVAGAGAGFGVYEVTKSGAPSTDLGNIGRIGAQLRW
ncbi:MAG: tetratricopeptide repeat protein [Kofleriaceae bacterium]